MNKQELLDYVNKLYGHRQLNLNNQEARQALIDHAGAVHCIQRMCEITEAPLPYQGRVIVSIPQTDLVELLEVVEGALEPKVTFMAGNYDAMQQLVSSWVTNGHISQRNIIDICDYFNLQVSEFIAMGESDEW